MKTKTKIPIIVAIMCILQYANQGITSLPSQALYYLTRETWGLSITMISTISWIIGLAWYLKIVFGYLVDNVIIRGKRNTYYLTGSYIVLISCYLYIIAFGLTVASIIITGLVINICIALSDVAVDREMVIAEKKHNLKGRLQSIQWTSLGVVGLAVSLGGAWIAHKFPAHMDYKIAYTLSLILPVIMLIYLYKYCKEKIIRAPKIKFKDTLKKNIGKLKNKRLIIGLLFIAFFQFSPSFGMALLAEAREALGIDKLFLGYLGATGTVLGVIGYILYYKWAYKFPLKKLLYFMIILTALDNICYLYIPNKWFLLIYSLMFSAFSGITFMTFLTFFVKIIPKGSEAFFYALVTSVSNFCGRLSGVFGGVIYDNWGYSATVIISAITTLLCLLWMPHLKIGEEK
jgi:MFS family permease